MKRIHSYRIARALALATTLGLTALGFLVAGPMTSWSARAAEAVAQISPGLVIPPMDPVSGKKLFATKQCVVCHSVNGVGGTDAPAIDAAAMESPMSPFDFFAKMWNHAYGMIAMQEDEIGGQITFENGQQLADVIAFPDDAEVQKTFTEADIPDDVKAQMDEGGMTNMQDNSMMDKNKTMMNGK